MTETLVLPLAAEKGIGQSRVQGVVPKAAAEDNAEVSAVTQGRGYGCVAPGWL